MITILHFLKKLVQIILTAVKGSLLDPRGYFLDIKIATVCLSSYSTNMQPPHRVCTRDESESF